MTSVHLPPRPHLRFSVFFLTCGYLGLLPRYVRGILAAFLAVPAMWLLMDGFDTALPRGIVAALIVFSFSLLTWRCIRHVLPHPPHDEEFIVIDEFLGGFLACVPMLFMDASVWYPWIAVSLFCLLDYFKPLFIGKLDDWQVPVAVVFDDLAAGSVAGIAGTAALLFLSL